jgi:predicted transposase YbfD/YdcC
VQAGARALRGSIRGHWRIETRLHSVRDGTFDEARSRVRTGAAPHVMAALRNPALTLLRRAGQTLRNWRWWSTPLAAAPGAVSPPAHTRRR